MSLQGSQRSSTVAGKTSSLVLLDPGEKERERERERDDDTDAHAPKTLKQIL